MDWRTSLKAQQTDFIQRLKSAKLLYCDEKDQHNEIQPCFSISSFAPLRLRVRKKY